MKRIAHSIGWTCLVLGLLIFVCDAYVLLRCGFDINDVYGITDNWQPIDWPTGLRPEWTFIPAIVYALGFWLVAAVAFAFWPEDAKVYRGRVRFGTE